jgi:hypothetical protein
MTPGKFNIKHVKKALRGKRPYTSAVVVVTGPPKHSQTIFVDTKAEQSYLAREVERFSLELDEVTPSSIYSTLPKLSYDEVQVRAGDDDIVIPGGDGRPVRIEVKVKGEDAVHLPDLSLFDAN